MHVHLQHQYFLKGGLRDMIENKKINNKYNSSMVSHV